MGIWIVAALVAAAIVHARSRVTEAARRTTRRAHAVWSDQDSLQ